MEVVDAIADWDEEAFIRTSIGRSYYAACLECRLFCERHLRYVRTRSSREHSQVQRLLAVYDQVLVDRLLFLRSTRNDADYEMSLSIDTLSIQRIQARSMSRRIIARLDELGDAQT